jgi:hypothetical protein
VFPIRGKQVSRFNNQKEATSQTSELNPRGVMNPKDAVIDRVCLFDSDLTWSICSIFPTPIRTILVGTKEKATLFILFEG